eukprot:gnl/TRDRNA2_/TRDRNA2_148866_c0_seq2.p1 gnl/TRDRNA2_/TRDRNA2_148866_c0~~gnl/TRDRNA2_/TRDRNA2_148866_c0_seq2.p1  ORF type:complete len:560 (+),score=82.12 gnl/TRDRNA2_/TRDRNA2_148866_c0_seq2:32-1681(+)
MAVGKTNRRTADTDIESLTSSKNSRHTAEDRPRPRPAMMPRRHSWADIGDSSRYVTDPSLRAYPNSPKSPSMPEQLRQVVRTNSVPSLNLASRSNRLPPLGSLSPHLALSPHLVVREGSSSSSKSPVVLLEKQPVTVPSFFAFRKFSSKPDQSTTEPSGEAERKPSNTTEPERQGGSDTEKQSSSKAEQRSWRDAKIDVPFSEAEQARVIQAFGRFASPEEGEVLREDLVLILALLGYISASEEDMEKVLSDISDFSTLDVHEFASIVVKISDLQEARVEAAFHAEDKAKSGKLKSPQCVQSLLRSLGIVALRTPVVEALEAADLRDNETLDFKEMLRVFKAYKFAEGFTRKETTVAHQAFREHADVHPGPPERKLLDPSELAKTLTQLFGFQVKPRACRLEKRLVNSEDAEPMDFREFLTFARHLRNEEVFEIWQRFRRATDEGRRVSVEQLTAQLPRSLELQGSDLRDFVPLRSKTLPMEARSAASIHESRPFASEPPLESRPVVRCRRLSAPDISLPSQLAFVSGFGNQRGLAQNSLARPRRNSIA